MSDTDSKKPVDVTEIDKLKMLVELGFGLSWEFVWVCNDGTVVHGSSDYQKSVTVNLIEGSLINIRHFETK